MYANGVSVHYAYTGSQMGQSGAFVMNVKIELTGANFLKTKSWTLLLSYIYTHGHAHLIASYLIKRTAHAAISVTLTK